MGCWQYATTFTLFFILINTRVNGAPAERAAYVVEDAAAKTAAARTGPGFVVHMTLDDEQLPEYGPSFKKLDVEVTPETVERLHVKILPSGIKRWEVPDSIVPRPGPLLDPDSTQRVHLLYAVHQPFDSPGDPFALKVMRKPADTPIFDSTGHRFLFKHQYIELSTAVPEDADLYGLGEVTLPTGLRLPRDGHTITLYNRDTPVATPYANLYGSHPFFLQVNSDGSSHGVLFLNSNGMDIVLNRTSLTYKVIGGLVDLYFFLGPTPEAVIRQYHEVVGAPAMPPYWALGVHQGRWGYSNVSVLEQVVANYSAAGIPLDCMWLDIEYMGDRFKTLTFDEHRFPASKMRAFVDKLHSQGQKWVPIHDAAIAKQKGYKAYEEGSRANVWVKDMHGHPYLGQVWPGEAVYPDYLAAPNISDWTRSQLQYFYDQVPFDGIWLDMNEASNFCSGNCKAPKGDKQKAFWLAVSTPKDYNLTALIPPRTTCQLECDVEPATNRLAHPPYTIHNFYWDKDGNEIVVPLEHKVMSPTAVYADGTTEYNAHNLFGTAMAMRTHAAAVEVMGRRPFMMVRSTFPGAGRFTGHWTGDNAANWQSFADSISGILNSNMWGLAMTGADICGFVDMEAYTGKDLGPLTQRLSDKDFQQLCVRWTSAGAFYPFARNHYGYQSRSHEPYRWPDVAAAARKAYGMRYRLLTYMYSSMHLAHSRGGTLARPLFFTDPADREARGVSKQWMMGESLLVSPVIQKDTEELEAHFTTGTWYSAWDYSRVDVPANASKQRTLHMPMGDVALHLRGGTIVPMQQQHPAIVTRDVRLSPVTLVVALPSAREGIDTSLLPYAMEETCEAAHQSHCDKLVSCGYMFMDSGDDVTVTADNAVQVWFTAVSSLDALSGTISTTVLNNAGEARSKLRIESVHVLGASSALDAKNVVIRVNDESTGHVEATPGVIKLSGLHLPVGERFEITWQAAPIAAK